jgi:hypothetical protein
MGMLGDLDEKGDAGGGGTMAVVVPESLNTVATTALVGRVWPIEKGQYSMPGPSITVGRSRDCDVMISEYSLSQNHCEFRFEPPRVYIIDLGSLNGTQIDGQKPPANEQVLMPERAQLLLGRFNFQYLGPSQLTIQVEQIINQ